MLIPYVLFFIGMILLIKGGDLFVDAATWFAKITGLPEVIIGATIVSLATTLPEATFSALSAVHNETAMSIGNAIGSIICNTGLILGICNLVKPSKINSRFFYVKGIMLLIYIPILWILASNGVIGDLASWVLFFMLVLYILLNAGIVQYNTQRVKKQKVKNNLSFHYKDAIFQVFQFFFGALLILVGAHLLVDYGVIIAQHWKIPTAIISLTLIAFGTSLPEFITSVSAIRKNHAALSIGNIIGSNILNVTMVIGVSANLNDLIMPPQTLMLDIPIAFILTYLLIIPSFFTKRISRPQAFIILLIYILYITFNLVYHI